MDGTGRFTVKQARMLRDKSQEECAEYINVHVNTWRKLEQNPSKMTVEQALLFCNFVNLKAKQINFLASDTT